MFDWFKRRGKPGGSYRSNEEWVEELMNPPVEETVQELRQVLVRGLKPALSKFVDRELDQFVEDVAQDSMLKILDKLDSFRGDSKFTTWAMKIAVREGLTELRRKRYSDVSLDEMTAGPDAAGALGLEMADEQLSPERAAHLSQLAERITHIMKEELTEKQLKAINALMVQGLPMPIVAEQMGTNRNALYKVVHDARMKLKNRLEREGIDPETMLDSM